MSTAKSYDTDELYDLRSDPGETRNLIDHPGYQDIVQSMRVKLYEKLKKTGGLMIPLGSKRNHGSNLRNPSGTTRTPFPTKMLSSPLTTDWIPTQKMVMDLIVYYCLTPIYKTHSRYPRTDDPRDCSQSVVQPCERKQVMFSTSAMRWQTHRLFWLHFHEKLLQSKTLSHLSDSDYVDDDSKELRTGGLSNRK